MTQRDKRGRLLPGSGGAVKAYSPNGRDRINLEKEAEDLLKWSAKEDSYILNDFTDTKSYLAQNLTEFAQRSDTFALALAKAKERIASRREKMCSAGKILYPVWGRTARLYDKNLLLQEDEDADKEAVRRTKSDATLSDKLVETQEALMREISVRQRVAKKGLSKEEPTSEQTQEAP